MAVTRTGEGADLLGKRERVESKGKPRFVAESIDRIGSAMGKERIVTIISHVC